MERPEHFENPPQENDKSMEKFFPKRAQTDKALEESGWEDLTKHLDDDSEEKKKAA